MWSSRLPSAWRDKFSALTLREQTAVVLALLAVVSFLAVQFLYLPLSDRRDQLAATIKGKEDDLKELKGIVSRYRQTEEDRKGKGAGSGEAFNLFSQLEKLATKSGLMDRIDYMKPGDVQLDEVRQEKWVEIKLTDLTLKEFATFLYQLYASGHGIYVKRLSARKNGEYLDLVVQPAVTEIR